MARPRQRANQDVTFQNMKAQTKKISELASVIPGFSPKPDERKSKGKYLLIGGRNISGGKLTATEKDSFVDEIARDSFERAKVIPGDIIVSTLFDRRKVYIYQPNDLPGVVNNSCAIIRSGEQSDYIVSFLKTIRGEEEFLEKAKQATSGACIPRLSTKSLADIQVPILPVAELALLGDNRIQNSSNDELVKLRNELAKKETEIAKLKGEHLERELFLQNRLQVIEAKIETNDLAVRIRSGETATLEFKSTLRLNIHTKNNDPKIENSALKTIVAFCNTKGGELLIGVSNEGSVLGLEQDFFPVSN